MNNNTVQTGVEERGRNIAEVSMGMFSIHEDILKK